MLALLGIGALIFCIYVFAFGMKYFGWILKVAVIYGFTVLSVVILAKAFGNDRPLESFKSYFSRHIPDKHKNMVIQYMPREDNDGRP
jgi:amino acid transporter